MRALIQRVRRASVTVEGQAVGKIEKGLVILLGIRKEDTIEEAHFLAEKCVNLRIFSDNDGKFNLSALNTNAEILVVSQFTLYGDCKKGRRPQFFGSSDTSALRAALPPFCRCHSKFRTTDSDRPFRCNDAR